jgi:methyl-accepting chemotaxis protein
MRIATKLMLFFGGVVVLFCVLATVLTVELRNISRTYDTLLNSSVRDMDRARVTQVNFKKEVQEWKDLLLRGSNPDDLAKYTKQFRDRSAEVDAGAAALAQTVQDPQAAALLQQFLAANQIMNEKYQRAYEVFIAQNADFRAADKMVRGQDRQPTDLFDQVVERLNVSLQAEVQAQAAAARRNVRLALGLSGGLLLLLGAAGLLTVRSILNRLASLQAVSERLARADISGLAIPVLGTDEIGQFGESMRGVSAAIEELLKMASAADPVHSL